MRPHQLSKLGAAFGVLLLTAPLLSACGGTQNSRIAGGSWQISDLYLDPEIPSGVPESIQGQASLVFGETSVVGNTGCAPFQGSVTFTQDGAAARADDADHISFDDVRFQDPDPATCTGQAVHVDQQLRELLSGEFTLSEPGEFELVLTRDTEEVNPPAIGLSSKSIPEREES
ncbi:hypothetical protein [Corynebacterium sp. A21]|uniref:hypothetical protein n=1 Tax=Corynebacterium sp. A21 TaxID=3457318 RepID=UPI003FD4CE17